MISDCNTPNTTDTFSLNESREKINQTILEILGSKSKFDSCLIDLDGNSQKEEGQSVRIKGRVLFPEGRKASPFSDFLSDSNNSWRRCSDNILSAGGDDPILQEFVLKNDSIGPLGEEIKRPLVQEPTRSSCLQYNDYYERAEGFLDTQGHHIVIPSEEQRARKHIGTDSTQVPQNGAKIDLLLSPTLSKVSNSSLLTRRQNSPLIKSREDSALLLQLAFSMTKAHSLPPKSSVFDEFLKRNSPDSHKHEIREEKKREEEHLLNDLRFDSNQNSNYTNKSTIFSSLQDKLHFDKVDLSKWKIIEENSPCTPLINTREKFI